MWEGSFKYSKGVLMRTYNNLIEFILKYGSSNLKYRVYKEILGESCESEKLIRLQEEILKLPKVKKAFLVQKESGFLGNVIHGVYFEGFDSTLNLLKRNGVELSNPNMQRAKESLLNWTDYEKDHFYKGGNFMDEHGRGGFRAIIAELLVELGCDEKEPIIQTQINYALEHFKGALLHTCVDDFTRPAHFQGRDCRYYIKDCKWPAANHVQILLKTSSWRNKENLDMVRKSYEHCKKIIRDYDGFIYINCGYMLGPFNHDWKSGIVDDVHAFDSNPIDFAWWMRRLASATETEPITYEPILGVGQGILDWIFSDDVLSELTDEHLRLYKKYASLELAWRKKESILCDIYFPIVLEIKRAGMDDKC